MKDKRRKKIKRELEAFGVSILIVSLVTLFGSLILHYVFEMKIFIILP